jgi:hypothetical protein
MVSTHATEDRRRIQNFRGLQLFRSLYNKEASVQDIMISLLNQDNIHIQEKLATVPSLNQLPLTQSS